jgi:hypothetical protein
VTGPVHVVRVQTTPLDPEPRPAAAGETCTRCGRPARWALTAALAFNDAPGAVITVADCGDCPEEGPST